MTLAWISGLGTKLVSFLKRFEDCFGRSVARELLKACVEGQLSCCQRKPVEPMAIKQDVTPRAEQLATQYSFLQLPTNGDRRTPRPTAIRW